MSNISGIGDSFINNYGQFFLNEIKSFVSVNNVEITEDEKNILSKLENRLVNINRRNRLLYSSKVNKDYGLDLFMLLNNIEGDIWKTMLNRFLSKKMIKNTLEEWKFCSTNIPKIAYQKITKQRSLCLTAFMTVINSAKTFIILKKL